MLPTELVIRMNFFFGIVFSFVLLLLLLLLLGGLGLLGLLGLLVVGLLSKGQVA